MLALRASGALQLMTMLPYSVHSRQCTHSHCVHSAVPDRVSGVRFVPSTNESSLSVEWSRPQSDAPILYYEIRYRGHIGRRSWQGPVNATTESASLRVSLVNSASYGVRVRAVSAIGEGPYSIEETVKSLFQHTHTHTHTRTYMHTHKHTHTHYICKYTSIIASVCSYSAFIIM